MDFQVPDPCCGASLQKGVKIIALIDMVQAAIGTGSLLLIVLLLLIDGGSMQDAATADEQNFPDFAEAMKLGTGMMVMILLAFMALNICYIFLAQFLLHGAMERNHRKIELWFAITLGVLLIRLIYYVVGIITATNFLAASLFAILGLGYQVYALWVVKAYLNELKRSGESLKIKDNYPDVFQQHQYL